MLLRPLICCFLSGSLLLTACDASSRREGASESTKGQANMDETMIVRLGEQAKSLIARDPVRLKLDAQPAGLDFVRAKWREPDLGSVEVRHGSVGLKFDKVLTFDATQDTASFGDEGITEIDVNMMLGDQDLIGHDEARVLYLALLESLRKSGWKSTVERGMPRLAGRDRFAYTMSRSATMGLDVDYSPTLTEWMRIGSQTPWGFWREGVYLEMSFMREHTMLDVGKPGAYVVTARVRTAKEEGRSLVEPVDRDHWHAALPGVLKQLDILREGEERDLRERGVAIFKDYRDPPLTD